MTALVAALAIAADDVLLVLLRDGGLRHVAADHPVVGARRGVFGLRIVVGPGVGAPLGGTADLVAAAGPVARMLRIGDPVRDVAVEVVADGVVAYALAVRQGRIVGFVDIIGLRTVEGLFAPGAVVVGRDGERGLRHGEIGRIAVGEKHAERRLTVRRGGVLLHVDVDGLADGNRSLQNGGGKVERAPLGVALRQDGCRTGQIPVALGLDAVCRGVAVHGSGREPGFRTGGALRLVAATHEYREYRQQDDRQNYRFEFQHDKKPMKFQKKDM